MHHFVAVAASLVMPTVSGKEATLLCLNKLTGAVIWKGPVPGGDRAGYASIIIANFGGQKQYIQFLKGLKHHLCSWKANDVFSEH